MALEAIPLQWFDQLSPRSIRGWEDLQRAFCENFARIISHPITLSDSNRREKRVFGATIEGLESYVHKSTTSLNERSLNPSPMES
jgi:hypothetical protein